MTNEKKPIQGIMLMGDKQDQNDTLLAFCLCSARHALAMMVHAVDEGKVQPTKDRIRAILAMMISAGAAALLEVSGHPIDTEDEMSMTTFAQNMLKFVDAAVSEARTDGHYDDCGWVLEW